MGVSGPHNGKYLHHVAEVVLHGSLLDTGAVGHQCAHSDRACKILELWDGFGDPGEVWGNGEPCTEVQPFSPGGSSGAVTSVFRLLHSVEVILQFMYGGIGQSCQECRCGKCKLKSQEGRCW